MKKAKFNKGKKAEFNKIIKKAEFNKGRKKAEFNKVIEVAKRQAGIGDDYRDGFKTLFSE